MAPAVSQLAIMLSVNNAPSQLQYWPTFWTPQEADVLLEHLQALQGWEQPKIRLYGKTLGVPRLSLWMADAGLAYRYSGICHQPNAWAEQVVHIKQRIEEGLGLPPNQRFNSVLLNLYRDGSDSNGWHSDDEAELDAACGIASASFGASRRFRWRQKAPPRTVLGGLDLAHGSLLWMPAGMQQSTQHCLTKTKKWVAPRINLTFRRLLDPKA